MMRPSRLARYQCGGSKLFEFVFVVLLVGVLSMAAEFFMLHYIEVAEKSAMEATVVNLKSSLRLRLSEILIHGDAQEAARVAMDNPMNWLHEAPPNYAGEFDDPTPGSIARGKWYFDKKSRELVYLVDQGDKFIADEDGIKRVRYQVYAPFIKKAVKENRQITVNEVVREISLVPVERYVWEFK